MTTVEAHALALQNLKAGYCAAADMSATDPCGARLAFADVFAPAVSGDYGAGAIVGADAVTNYLCDAIGGSSRWLLHMIHSPWIRIDGDRAVGRWTVLVHLGRHGGRVDVVRGRYVDDFRYDADGWRIAHVRFVRVGD